MRRLMPWTVALVALALLVVLALGLRHDPRALPSALLDQPAPPFSLPRLDRPDDMLSLAHLRGQVSLVNVWASWCGACQIEHALLVELSRAGQVPIYGLNYKDQRPAALDWLRRHGDPYRASASDTRGHTGLDFGVQAVPETFVLDREGVIRHRHVGPVTRQVIDETLLPLVRQLGG